LSHDDLLGLLRDFSEAPAAEETPSFKGPERHAIGRFADSDVNGIPRATLAVGVVKLLSSTMSDYGTLFLNSPLQQAAEFSGVAGEFRCHSLHRSQIFKDL